MLMFRFMDDYQIEKGLPIPPADRAGETSGLVEVMKQMEVGDSVLVPKGKGTKNLPYAGLREKAKRAGIQITIRKIDENSLRFWRTQ